MKQIYKTARIILEVAAPVLYILLGVAVMVFCHSDKEADFLFLGIALVVVSSLNFLFYFHYGKGINVKTIFPLVLCLGELIIGILTIIEKIATYKAILIAWGIIDICIGSFDIVYGIIESKEDKLSLIDILLGLGDIIFGIFLCIHLQESLHNHLLFLSISCFINAVIKCIHLIIFVKKNKTLIKHQ